MLASFNSSLNDEDPCSSKHFMTRLLIECDSILRNFEVESISISARITQEINGKKAPNISLVKRTSPIAHAKKPLQLTWTGL
jgi:hypothetical protein